MADVDCAWRWIYVVGAVVALYLNVFVGVVVIRFRYQAAPSGLIVGV